MNPRQSAAVYRRRRIVFFGGVIVVLAILVVLVWSLIARSWSEGSGPAPTPSTSSSASPDPATSTAPPADGGTGAETSPPASEGATPPPEDGTGACQAAGIAVEAVTDASSYGPDVQPQLSISLTNTGAQDCTINVGTTQQRFEIKSGDDVWWRSTDCQQNPSDMVVTLKAGSTVTSSQPVVWDRTRSTPETCGSAERQRAPGGGATYHLSVSIGGFDSAQSTAFTLE
ncbi:hypothetical protein [Microbacterium resistens]|uniref:hypothetical protein n=1 Tax=Microbacterium resistens TaxID=156977 RepID=UPI00082C94B3|nr:hypothetical protein [Microbacterium resistens]